MRRRNAATEKNTIMKDLIKELDEHLEYVDHEIEGEELRIYVQSNRDVVKCPYCGQESGKCHSLYERSFQDLPIMGKKTKIILTNRKMFFQNPDCGHKTFAERFDFLTYKGKRTKRLTNKIIEIALHTSSVAASGSIKDGIADVGKSTICTLLKKRSGNSSAKGCHKSMY